MDQETLSAYDAKAASFAQDWHDQPAPSDLHAVVKRYFRPGATADIGCGSGREVAWLAAAGFAATGYDASSGLLQQARARYPRLAFAFAALPELTGIADASFDNVLCETVIMHLPKAHMPPAVALMLEILKAWRDFLSQLARGPGSRPARRAKTALLGVRCHGGHQSAVRYSLRGRGGQRVLGQVRASGGRKKTGLSREMAR